MLALYTLGAGLIISGLFVVFTLLGGWMTRRIGPTPGFVAAGMMGILTLMPLGTLLNYLQELGRLKGLKGAIYYFCFTAGVAIPVVTGLCCTLLLFLTARFAVRRKKRRRLHQQG